jgi:hypothetical protein
MTIFIAVESIPKTTSMKRIPVITDPILSIAEYTSLSVILMSERPGYKIRDTRNPGMSNTIRNPKIILIPSEKKAIGSIGLHF